MGFGLTLGAVDLLGTPSSGAWWIEALGEEADFGTPVPVEQAITSFLQDGAIAVVESYDNREMTLRLRMGANSSAALAAAEAALVAEVGERNTLTWTPADNGPACVFDVVSSQLDHAFADLDELQFDRIYKLTIKALPFARPAAQLSVTSPAPPSTSVTTVSVDPCTSTTGWTGSPNAPFVVGGTLLREDWTNGSSTSATTTLKLTRTGTVVVTSTRYIRLDFNRSSNASAPVVKINGTTVSETARNGDVAWYYSPSTTVTSISVEVTVTATPGGAGFIGINDVSRSDQPRDQAGQRQTFRSLAVAGSCRTQGNLAVEDTSAALGSTLVYTSPNNVSAAQPPLRPFYTGTATETADGTAVSGKNSYLATRHTFDIPAAQVPVGGYVLMARVQHATGGDYTLTYAGRSRMGGGNDAGQSGTTIVAVPSSTWKVVPVAKLVLPTRQMGSAGLVRIELTGPTGLMLDEAWLFNTDAGRLTWVEAGIGTPAAGGAANRLWLDAASVTSPVPSVWLGNAADRSDAYGAGEQTQSFGDHQFVPPTMNVFTVTTNSVATAVTLKYYPRYFSHVA